MELKFDYDENFADAFMAGFGADNPVVMGITHHSVFDSTQHAKSGEFLSRFVNSPNTIDTQVDMYVGLVDHVCKKMVDGFKEYAPRIGATPDVYNEESLAELLGFVRIGYTQASLTEIVSIRKNRGIELPLDMDTLPLGLAYVFQRLTDEGADLGDLSRLEAPLLRSTQEYLGKCKLPTEARHQFTNVIVQSALILAK